MSKPWSNWFSGCVCVGYTVVCVVCVVVAMVGRWAGRERDRIVGLQKLVVRRYKGGPGTPSE